MLAVYDAPDPDAPCPVRFTTTQPTQALEMINSAFVNQQAKVFADSLRQEAGGDRRCERAHHEAVRIAGSRRQGRGVDRRPALRRGR